MARDFCYKCHRPQDSCICSFLSTIDTKTHIVILIHPMERQKIKNGTGKMTHLQLANSSLIYGIDFTQDKKVNQLIENHRCSLLYPGEESINLSEISNWSPQGLEPEYIFVLDATWPLAKKMLRLSPNLQKLSRVSFSSELKSEFAIKQQPHQKCLSTIESTKVLLEELKRINLESSSLDMTKFLDPFKEMIRYQIECIERPDNNRHHHSSRYKLKVLPKTKYKKKGSRGLFFES